MCWSPTFLRKKIFSALSRWCEQCMIPGWPRLERQSTCMLVCREHSQVLCKRYVDTQFSSLEMPHGIIYLLTPFPRAWLLWTHSTTFGQNLNLTHKHLTLSAKCGFFCCWGWWMSLETTHRFTFNFSLASPYLQVRWRSIELTSSNMWVGRRCFDNFRLVGTTCNTPSLSHLQVIQLTRISSSQLTVQQFFSLYKAFHIWPNKVRRVGECLIHDTIVVFFWLVHAYYCHK